MSTKTTELIIILIACLIVAIKLQGSDINYLMFCNT